MRRELRHPYAPRHQVATFEQRPVECFPVKRHQHRTFRNSCGKLQQHRVLLRKIAHHELLELQASRVPPRDSDQECIRASSAGESRGLRVQKKPFLWIFGCRAPLLRSRRILCSAQQVERRRSKLWKFRSRIPVTNAQMVSVPGTYNRCAQQFGERTFVETSRRRFFWRRLVVAQRRRAVRRAERRESRKFVQRGHLSADLS